MYLCTVAKYLPVLVEAQKTSGGGEWEGLKWRRQKGLFFGFDIHWEVFLD